MATLNYAKAKALLTRGIIDSPIRAGLSAQKSYELLLLEKQTIREITKAYEIARNEIAKELQERYGKYLKEIESLTVKQKELMQIKMLRDAQLYENLETRIGQLGGTLDKVNARAILEASGISNEFIEKELQTLTFFTNLDPQNFARINTLQAELTVNHVNQGTKFVNEAIKKDTLDQMRQQMRISILKGESIDKLTDRIVSRTGLTTAATHFQSIEQRARLNARWGIIESASAASNTQYNAFNQRCQESGIQTRIKKQVISAIDDRTTLCCICAQGQIQDIGVPFDTEQGSFDYPPFHCNCRSTTAAWHELFEAYGQSTKDMIDKSKKELEKRSADQAKKNASRNVSKKTLAKQQTQKKAAATYMNKTISTAPGTYQIPTLDVVKATNTMSTNEAQNILSMPTNSARKEAITKSQAEKSSMETIAQNHVAKVQKSGKIPKELLDYDKEVFKKGTLNLGDAADLVRKAELPGNVDIIGGLARRGNTQHDIDLLIRAKNTKLADIQEKLKPLYEEFRKRGISMDAYIEHSAGITMGDPNTWVQGTEKYLEMLIKNHQDWTFRIPKYTDDIIALGKKIKVIPGQQDLFSVTYETIPKAVVKPKPITTPPTGELKSFTYNQNTIKLYADDVKNLEKMKKSGAKILDIKEQIRVAEDRVINNVQMFKSEIKTLSDGKRTMYFTFNETPEAIAKRDIIAKRLDLTFDQATLKKEYIKYLEKDLKDVMEWIGGNHRISIKDLFMGEKKIPKEMTKLKDGKLFKFKTPEAKVRFDKADYDDFVNWMVSKVDSGVLDRAGTIDEFLVEMHTADTRAYYQNAARRVMVDTADNKFVMIHEYSHHLQYNNYQIDAVMQQIFKERTAGMRLERIYPYLSDNKEMGYVNAFCDRYMGKVYEAGTRQQREAVEMLSMSMQKMAENPTYFAQREPELFQVVIGFMCGLL